MSVYPEILIGQQAASDIVARTFAGRPAHPEGPRDYDDGPIDPAVVKRAVPEIPHGRRDDASFRAGWVAGLAAAEVAPPPDWYQKVKNLLADVSLAAAVTGSDMAALPARVANLRAQADRDPGWEPPSRFLAAVDSAGQDTRVPVWVFDSGVQLDGAASVSAWVEGVAADGELSTGAAIDAIERDACRLLAAVAWHRRVAGTLNSELKVPQAEASHAEYDHTIGEG